MKAKKLLVQVFEMATIFLAVLVLFSALFAVGFFDYMELSEQAELTLGFVIPGITFIWFACLPAIRKRIGEKNLEMLPKVSLILNRMFCWIGIFQIIIGKFRTALYSKWLFRL